MSGSPTGPGPRDHGSLQFHLLGFCGDEDGDVRIGVLPEREKILIGRLGFGGVALHGIGAGKAEMRGGAARWMSAFLEKTKDLGLDYGSSRSSA